MRQFFSSYPLFLGHLIISLSLSFLSHSLSLLLFFFLSCARPTCKTKKKKTNEHQYKRESTITEPFLSVAQPTPPPFPLPFFFLACARPAIPSPSFARAIQPRPSARPPRAAESAAGEETPVKRRLNLGEFDSSKSKVNFFYPD